jgi:hypothetical protein
MKNIRMVCEHHAPKPDPKFLEHPPEWFIGKFVKLGFPANDGSCGKEHMWLKVHGLGDMDKNELVGELNNQPITTGEYALGDDVAFNRSEIEEVMG